MKPKRMTKQEAACAVAYLTGRPLDERYKPVLAEAEKICREAVEKAAENGVRIR